MVNPPIVSGQSDDQRSRHASWLKRGALSVGLWMILLTVALAWIGIATIDAMGGRDGVHHHLGSAAVVPLVFVHAVASVSPFPGEVIAFGNSMLFGFTVGFLCNWCGWMLGAVMQYWLAWRTTADLRLHDAAAWQYVPNWLRTVPLHHPLFLIGGRWLPFGAHLVNTTAGALRVPFVRHLWCSAIGIIPIAALVAALGSGVAQRFWSL